MSIKSLANKKSEVFGTISSYKTILNDYPKLKQVNSYPSINNINDPIQFLVDLFKSLSGEDELKTVIKNILTKNLNSIETSIKEEIKNSLKEFISCSVSPTMPIEIINNGVTFSIDDIDYKKILQKSPCDEVNGNYYFDNDCSNDNFLTSNDFNVFLWYIINKSSNSLDNNFNTSGDEWFQRIINGDSIKQIYNNKILRCSFLENNNNSLNVIPNSKYTDNTITVFNNDYIDSLKLFDTKTIVMEIMDRLFGVSKKNNDDILTDEQINKLLEKCINCPNNEIDDSFFSFSNEEYDELLLITEKRKSGVYVDSDFNGKGITISNNMITGHLENIKNSNSISETNNIIDSILNDISNNSSNNNSDIQTFRINLIIKVLKELLNTIVSILLHPKISIIFKINEIITGTNVENELMSDFLKRNKKMIYSIIQNIKSIIVKEMLNIIKEKILSLTAEMNKEIIVESLKQYNDLVQNLLYLLNKNNDNQNIEDLNNIKYNCL